METTIINNELNLSFPEDFHVLNAEELQEVYMNDEPNRWAIRNTEKHVMIAVLWQETNRLLAALADLKAVARRNEQLMKNGLIAFDYKCNGFITEEVCGQQAQGYCYEYVNQGISQHARTLLIKCGRNIYGFTCYTRGPMDEEAAKTFRDVLDSVEKA